MPYGDLVQNRDLSQYHCGGDSVANKDNVKNDCNCNCDHEQFYPQGYWCPPMPPHDCSRPPYPDFPYCPPVNPNVGSTEAQIAKLSKKAATIRKMIHSLVNCNKPIIISVGRGTSYNFGGYLDSEQEETEYGKAILDMLESELEAIKDKIKELTEELDVEEDGAGIVEKTVTM